MNQILSCVQCSKNYPILEVRYHCDCGGLLTVQHIEPWGKKLSKEIVTQRRLSYDPIDESGVWAWREAIIDLPKSSIVTHPEGRTRLYQQQRLAEFAGLDQVWLKHEGENPTGSFKDRGMTVAISMAKHLGMQFVGCASTGNTSASLAAYAAQAGLRSIVFIPQGKIATGKLAQAIGYGAKTVAIRGDFDQAMQLVQEAAKALGIYLVNSINPFRLEGQKSIMFEMIMQLGGDAPDWVVVPAGNLGNTSAFGKALREAYEQGWISRIPRIAAVQASGANPFYRGFCDNFKTVHRVKAETVATAIRIGNPVNLAKAVKVMADTSGVVTEVSDEDILAAKKAIDRSGIGCEPASAASLAGAKRLVREGIIKPQDRVVCILTGHILKDAEAILGPSGLNITEINPTLQEVEKILA